MYFNHAARCRRAITSLAMALAIWLMWNSCRAAQRTFTPNAGSRPPDADGRRTAIRSGCPWRHVRHVGSRSRVRMVEKRSRLRPGARASHESNGRRARDPGRAVREAKRAAQAFAWKLPNVFGLRVAAEAVVMGQEGCGRVRQRGRKVGGHALDNLIHSGGRDARALASPRNPSRTGAPTHLVVLDVRLPGRQGSPPAMSR